MDINQTTVNVFAIANSHHQYEQRSIFDAGNNSIATDSVLPELAQLRFLQRFTDASWVVQRGHLVAQKMVMRRATGLSSLARSLIDALSNLISQSKAALRFCQ
jgi:hypothetical protein